MTTAVRTMLSRLRRRLRAPPAPPPPQAAPRPGPVPAPPGLESFDVPCCTMFFSYFRVELSFAPHAIGFDAGQPIDAEIHFPAGPPLQTVATAQTAGRRAITAQALIDPNDFPGNGALVLRQNGQQWRVAIATLLALAAQGSSQPLFPEFTSAIAAWSAAHAPARPRLLDIGGRARSGIQRSEHFPECDVTTLDIVPAAGVDIVCDAHEMSTRLPAASFDFALCVAVFEHLAMPWKVAIEMAKVIRPGGIALIFTHQTIGMHDLPWDFFRFSDSAWSAIFNRYTGFEIIETRLTAFMHILPRAWTERHRGAEQAGGFEGSAVMVRRIGDPLVEWPVSLPDILQTSYPRA